MVAKISVIVLSYNYENYIKDNLQSLLNQTDTDFEVIVVDDGSKDKSCDVIESIIVHNKTPINIKLYFHENHQNKGIVESYKFALSKCNCDYVSFCESDDYWHPDYIKNLKLTIDETNAAFIACKISCVNQSSNTKYDEYVENCNNRLEKLSTSNKNVFRYLLRGNPIPTFSSVCVKKDILLSCDFNTVYPPYLDLWLWRQIGMEYNLAFSKNSLCYWRKHDSSYDMVTHLNDLQNFFISNNELLMDKYVKSKLIQSVFKFVKLHFSSKNYFKYQNSLLKRINKRIVNK